MHIQNIGVISLRELHKHACPIVMYGLKLFIVVFPKSKVFSNMLICLIPARHQILASFYM